MPVTDLVLHLALVIATPSVLHSEQPTGKKVVPTTRGGAVNYGSSCFKQGGRRGRHPGKICTRPLCKSITLNNVNNTCRPELATIEAYCMVQDDLKLQQVGIKVFTNKD